ncbi:MAG: nitrile hydratase accessory protein [Betaproteobacteria bacterium]|nr:nitrile hydratase accessory protein [Betaproteobacteria bacterium]
MPDPTPCASIFGTTILSLPELGPDLRPIPRDADGPVFKAPWEAQVFALVVQLHRRGAYTWPQWAAALTSAIARAQAAGDADLGDTYYLHWVAALEALASERGLADAATLSALAATIAEDARHHREIQLAGGHHHHDHHH